MKLIRLSILADQVNQLGEKLGKLLAGKTKFFFRAKYSFSRVYAFQHLYLEDG